MQKFLVFSGKRTKYYTLQDVMAIYAPHMISIIISVIGLVFIYDPSFKLLIHSCMPLEWRTPLVLAICAVEELRHLLMLGAIYTPIWQLPGVIFETVLNNYRFISGSTKRR